MKIDWDKVWDEYWEWHGKKWTRTWLESNERRKIQSLVEAQLKRKRK